MGLCAFEKTPNPLLFLSVPFVFPSIRSTNVQKEKHKTIEMNDQNDPSEKKVDGQEAATCTADSMEITPVGNGDIPDPLLAPPSNIVRDGDTVILVFGDGKQIFAQCLKSWKGKSPPVKINKRSYPTSNLVGLPYGTVLELGISGLSPLPEGEDLVPSYPNIRATAASPAVDLQNARSSQLEDEEANADDSTFPSIEQSNDNRHLVDDNTSQSLQQSQLERLRQAGTDGSAIVEALIENSVTFDQKTEFSKAKYVARKQKKYQPRCRMVRCSPYSICEVLFQKEPRKMQNMREDTLGQILSYSNVSAGCQVLVMETCMGVLTGALAHRMGGYGKVISIYSGQQPPYMEMIQRFNLSFAEHQSIKWLHSGDAFAEDVVTSNDPEEQDPEKEEREALEWPCPLQDHTRTYLENMGTVRDRKNFLAKRCARFARKLTRHSSMETKEWLLKRPCDSIILVTRYDPTATLLELLPYLAPSCPFVVYSEYIEPLSLCFMELQKQGLAINIRLSDTWMREYQVLPGRTHPAMNMSQSGGYILTGIKLCPVTGHNELDDNLLKELRGLIGGRRGRKTKHKNGSEGSKNGRKKNKRSRTETENGGTLPSQGASAALDSSKRMRGEDDSSS
jgi:tRNA (adenine-N(1)-)-methyltransferase non-catalytic subunit